MLDVAIWETSFKVRKTWRRNQLVTKKMKRREQSIARDVHWNILNYYFGKKIQHCQPDVFIIRDSQPEKQQLFRN